MTRLTSSPSHHRHLHQLHTNINANPLVERTSSRGQSEETTDHFRFRNPSDRRSALVALLWMTAVWLRQIRFVLFIFSLFHSDVRPQDLVALKRDVGFPELQTQWLTKQYKHIEHRRASTVLYLSKLIPLVWSQPVSHPITKCQIKRKHFLKSNNNWIRNRLLIPSWLRVTSTSQNRTTTWWIKI